MMQDGLKKYVAICSNLNETPILEGNICRKLPHFYYSFAWCNSDAFLFCDASSEMLREYELIRLNYFEHG